MNFFTRNRLFYSAASKSVFTNPLIFWLPSVIALVIIISTLVVLFGFALAGLVTSGIPLTRAGIEGLGSLEGPVADFLLYSGLFLLTAGMTLASAVASATAFVLARASLEGQVLAIREVLQLVWAKRILLAVWSALSAAISVLLQVVEDKLSWAGSIMASIGRFSWSVASFFMVPILITNSLSYKESLLYSVSLIKKTWGEAAVLTFGFGFLQVIVFLESVLLAGLVVWGRSYFADSALSLEMAIPGIVVGVLSLVVGTIYVQSLTAITQAALFRYAETGDFVGPFSKELLAGAFTPKKP